MLVKKLKIKKNSSTVADALASPLAWLGYGARPGPAPKPDTAAQCGARGARLIPRVTSSLSCKV